MTKAVWSWPRFVALLPLAFAALSTCPAAAHYREPCWVQYRYSEGWSPPFKVKCDYASGTEMNRIFRTGRYLHYKDYVILRFAVDGPIVVRIHQPAGCGEVAERGCVSNGGNFLTGRDESGHSRHGVNREWAICQPGDEGRLRLAKVLRQQGASPPLKVPALPGRRNGSERPSPCGAQ